MMPVCREEVSTRPTGTNFTLHFYYFIIIITFILIQEKGFPESLLN